MRPDDDGMHISYASLVVPRKTVLAAVETPRRSRLAGKRENGEREAERQQCEAKQRGGTPTLSRLADAEELRDVKIGESCLQKRGREREKTATLLANEEEFVRRRVAARGSCTGRLCERSVR